MRGWCSPGSTIEKSAHQQRINNWISEDRTWTVSELSRFSLVWTSLRAAVMRDRSSRSATLEMFAAQLSQWRRRNAAWSGRTVGSFVGGVKRPVENCDTWPASTLPLWTPNNYAAINQARQEYQPPNYPRVVNGQVSHPLWCWRIAGGGGCGGCAAALRVDHSVFESGARKEKRTAIEIHLRRPRARNYVRLVSLWTPAVLTWTDAPPFITGTSTETPDKVYCSACWGWLYWPAVLIYTAPICNQHQKPLQLLSLTWCRRKLKLIKVNMIIC